MHVSLNPTFATRIIGLKYPSQGHSSENDNPDADPNTFDPGTLVSSRFLHINLTTGAILDELPLGAHTKWDGLHDWDANNCAGERPFIGGLTYIMVHVENISAHARAKTPRHRGDFEI